nr:hypothetical protein Iba_scaffold3831CG0040 [Ipomoea batatas]
MASYSSIRLFATALRFVMLFMATGLEDFEKSMPVV